MVEKKLVSISVRLQPFEQPVEAGVTGNRAEEAIEPFLHDGREERGRALPALVELPYIVWHDIGYLGIPSRLRTIRSV